MSRRQLQFYNLKIRFPQTFRLDDKKKKRRKKEIRHPRELKSLIRNQHVDYLLYKLLLFFLRGYSFPRRYPQKKKKTKLSIPTAYRARGDSRVRIATLKFHSTRSRKTQRRFHADNTALIIVVGARDKNLHAAVTPGRKAQTGIRVYLTKPARANTHAWSRGASERLDTHTHVHNDTINTTSTSSGLGLTV